MKNRLNKEGSETVTKCNRLKLVAKDGKMRNTDAADPETLLRLIQSVPSPKAEPIKIWLARVGYERMQDMVDPARSLDRAREYWQLMLTHRYWQLIRTIIFNIIWRIADIITIPVSCEPVDFTSYRSAPTDSAQPPQLSEA